MDNNQFSPNAISHKDLNALLNKAKKEIFSLENPGNNGINKNREFNDLLKDWSNTSQKILAMLSKSDQVPTKNTNPKSLMAFGAMGAHINMALKALKATELDQ